MHPNNLWMVAKAMKSQGDGDARGRRCQLHREFGVEEKKGHNPNERHNGTIENFSQRTRSVSEGMSKKMTVCRMTQR